MLSLVKFFLGITLRKSLPFPIIPYVISNKETFLRFILSSILDDPDLLMAFTFEIKSETLSGLS